MIAFLRGKGALMVLALLCGAFSSLPATVSAQQALLDFANENNEANLLSNGGFEADVPAYWTPSGDGAEWTTEAARTPEYSLKLSGSGEAAWTQEEAVRNWVSGIGADQEFLVGGWVRTEGVNTNPTGDEEKFQLLFEFFDASGTDLLGGPVAIDVPQAEASTGDWVQIDNAALGSLSLPAAAPSARITFRKGANATGTVYLDDVFTKGIAGEYPPGAFFNTNVDAGDTWYYWWPDFELGREDWPENQAFIQTVTEEEAHTGSRSLKLVQNDPDASESVAISDRVPVTPGEPVLVSFWVKTEGVLNPDSIGTADYNIGLTALWYNNLEGGSAGWGEVGGLDIRLNGDYNPNVIPLVPRQTETDWTQYAFIVYPREDAVGVELRLRYWHHFEGTTYWDDVSIVNIGGDALLVPTAIEEPGGSSDLPERISLHQNYPNPFNPSTTISFDLLQREHVTLEVYNLLGQRVATLIDGRDLAPGTHAIRFEADELSSGVYLYMLKTEQRTESRVMVLIR